MNYIYTAQPFQIKAKMEELTNQDVAAEFIDKGYPWQFYMVLVDFAERAIEGHVSTKR